MHFSPFSAAHVTHELPGHTKNVKKHNISQNVARGGSLGVREIKHVPWQARGDGASAQRGQGKTRVTQRLTKFQKILNGAKPYGANGGEQLKKGQKIHPQGNRVTDGRESQAQ